jgi:hypothetical protein
MPPHNGIHDYARVRIVNAFGAERFTLLAKPAEGVVEKTFDLGVIGAASKAETDPLRLARGPGNRRDPAGHPSGSRCRV